VPLSWATTQNNLGCALYGLGQLKGDSNTLEAAMAAYQQALQILTGA